MILKSLIVLCFVTFRCCTSSSDNWCVSDDDIDAYQSAIYHVASSSGSSSINRSQLQQLIDDVFMRAGCNWLQMTSANNINCKKAVSYTHLTLPTKRIV